MTWLVRRMPISLLLGLILSSCASQAIGPDLPTITPTIHPALGACAEVGPSIGRHPAFPASVPLPPGTIITAWEERSAERIIVYGFAPSDVQGVAVFLERELPAAGFQPTFGESEPGEAEGAFEGNGYRGRWITKSIHECPNVVSFSVVTGP